MVIAVLVMGVTAAISFQVRELVAALLMFSVVFGAIGAGLLLMMLVEEVALLGVARTATRLAPVKDRLTLFRNTLASARHLKSH